MKHLLVSVSDAKCHPVSVSDAKRSHTKRRTAWFLITVLVAQLFAPYSAYALTGGPSQPEVQSFEPIGTSEMVDVSSGSFTYNIPLMEVGGYPLNLAYHSGATPDDEASVCGLGWNINPGVVNRNMRGLPDDFKGDVVNKEFNMKPNKTWGGSIGGKFELFGLSKKSGGKKAFNLGVNLGVLYNNYKGVGFEFGLMPGFSAGDKGSMTYGLGLTANSQSGVTVSPSLSYSTNVGKAQGAEGKGNLNGGLSIGAPINSRMGLSAMTVGASLGISASGVGKVRSKNKDAEGNRIKVDKAMTNSRSLFGTSSTFNFASPTYAPAATLPFSNFSISGTFSLGLETAGGHPAVSVSGYFSKQELAQNSRKSPAYGFLYAENGTGNENSLMDFNREKDGAPFTKHTPNLPLPVFTNDIYGATGQGIAGSYQLKRGDIGVLSDASVQSLGSGISLSGEIGFGLPPGVHGGADIVVNSTDTRSNRWTQHNPASSTLAFVPPITNNPNYEPAYFKIAGEKSVETDFSFFASNGGKDPVRVKLEAGNGLANMNVKTKPEWEGPSPGTISQVRRTKRERRNQSIAWLTAGEADQFGLEKTIRDYAPNVFNGTYAPIARTDASIRRPWHLSEIALLRQDGLRYFYGIPAYNLTQKEVSFSTKNSGDCQTGISAIATGEDTPQNTSGLDQYFNKVELPAYAHSYLLTAIVSQDFVDLKKDGPTPDDYGTYTKFNYSRVKFNNPSPMPNYVYPWRVPYEDKTANFNEGFKSDKQDNKANYLYGEKEYWVLHSIESKTQVAEFNYDLAGRADAKSAIAKQPLPKLLSISLFSTPERRPSGGFNAAAVPIKTVWFDYDHSLCQGVKNNFNTASGTKGKLSLTKLWFTYGASQKGKLSPYKFKYGIPLGGTVAVNPDYGLKNYNRWGSYQKNLASAGTGCYDSPNTGLLNTSDYPYVPQDPSEADKNAYAYNLTEITLPSGGNIKVEYEANRYAYTQDRRAMEMFDVVGAGPTSAPSIANLTNNELYSGSVVNNFLYFKLRKKLLRTKYPNSNVAKDELWRQYFKANFGQEDLNADYLYFKFLINVDRPGQNGYEYVPGYLPIKNYGVVETSAGGDWEYGYIEVAPVKADDKGPSPMTNPISRTAFQFARMYLPKIAYGETNVNESDPGEQIIRALASMGKQMVQFVEGFNQWMHSKDYARQFVPGKSWIRLYSPEKNKIAGGCRVKSIRIADAWDKMAPSTGAIPADYGQTYDYTDFEVVNGDTLHYSSGVAAWEPMAGGDENPFRRPVFFTEKVLLAPDNQFFQEEPFGESFFPAPTITYSRVTVRNLSRAGVKRTATGAVVHEFFTAKDFPTKTSTTGLRAVPKKTNPIFKQLKLKHKDYMTASQGFAIELNDMHGKPRAQWVYDESGARISGVEYFYKRSGDRLVNESIPVVTPCGAIENKIVGMESSLVADTRESYTKTGTFGVQLNSDNFLAGVFPLLTVIPLPSFHQEEMRFRSMVTTKVVQHYGILEKTVAYDLGASVSTENLAWDAETGEVVLTKTSNEFGDPIYNTNIPAHWGYEGMRGAYQNLGAVFTNAGTSNGKYTTPNFRFFTPGDEVSVNGSYMVWVKDVTPVSATSGEVYFIQENGQTANFSGVTLKILRSGRRNQQLSSVGSVTSKRLPYNTGGTALDFTGKEVLNAGAMEYSDRWQTWCGDGAVKDTCICKDIPQTGSPGGEFLALLNGLLVSNQFQLKPKSAAYNITSQINSLKSIIDGLPYSPTCPTGGSASGYYFAAELVGNDLVCSFGRSVVMPPVICWASCVTIKDFAILVNSTPPIPTFKFLDLVAAPLPGKCDGKRFCFKANVETYKSQQGTPYPAWRADVYTFCGDACFAFTDCRLVQIASGCGHKPGDVANPYRTNNRGVFRPLRSWTYLAERSQTNPANIRTDGAFSTFTPFWAKPTAPCTLENPPTWSPSPANWTWASEVTRYNPVGNELENRDALDRYSAELVGYRNTQMTATAANARYRQIAFDGFEDYFFNLGVTSAADCPLRRHINFDQSLVKTEASHSGKYALKLAANASTEVKNDIKLPVCPAPLAAKTPNVPFALDACDCVGLFSPDPGKYVFSAWVREERPAGALQFDQASVDISFGSNPSAATFKAAGPIIEGWQRVYGEFDVPTGATDIRVKLKAAPSFISWFDDLRIHPFDARFKSFVYDDVNLRFTYELDENNFFTRYEYDQQGMLERIKKETERGVMTIQESRFGQQKMQ